METINADVLAMPVDAGGTDIAEIETLQAIDKACELVRENIRAFRMKMLRSPARRCYDNALYIYCAEQIAYYFDEHIGAMDDDERLGLYNDGQLRTLSYLCEKGQPIMVLLWHIIDRNDMRMSNMGEVDESVCEILSMWEIADSPDREVYFSYIMSSSDAAMW